MPSYFISQQVLSKTILKIWRAMSNEEGAKSNRPRLINDEPNPLLFLKRPINSASQSNQKKQNAAATALPAYNQKHFVLNSTRRK
jgi:hypothetical protein